MTISKLVSKASSLTHVVNKMESDIIAMVLNISSNEQFHQFLQCAINEFVGKKVIGHENINNDIDWPIENQTLALKYFQNVFKNVSIYEDFKISEKLSELGDEKVRIVEDCYNIRKSEILNKLQTDILTKQENPLVTNFDWKLKWIIGSSSLSSIREPVAQVDLYTLTNKGDENVRDKIYFEMNLSEIDSFIGQLQSAINNLKKN